MHPTRRPGLTNLEKKMKHFLLPIGLAASILSAAEPTTPSLENTVGIGAGVGGQIYNGTFGEGTTLTARGLVRYHPLEWLGARLAWEYGNLSNGQEYSTQDLSQVSLDLVLQPQGRSMGGFRPYLASGVSYMFGTSTLENARGEAVQNKDLTGNLSIPVELGAEFLIDENWSIWGYAASYIHAQEWDRLDGERSGEGYFENRDDVYRVGLGATFRFGIRLDEDGDMVVDGLDKCPGTPAKVKVDLQGCPVDNDSDRVPDYMDKCPGTPKASNVDSLGCPLDADKDGVADYVDVCPKTPTGVLVDSRGCPLDADKDGVPDFQDKCGSTPAGVKVDARGCPADLDKDGVTDDKDACLGTRPGVKVDAKGCPLDQDKDGVVDDQDKCPGTKAGEKVDSVGCPLLVIEKGARLTLDGIVFKTGSAEIDSVSFPTLGRAAEALAKAPTVVVEIAGFTDNVGKDAANRNLSRQRAEAVRTYLVKLGAPKKSLTAKGYGAAEPVADNGTEAGRAQNRRIEFRVK